MTCRCLNRGGTNMVSSRYRRDVFAFLAILPLASFAVFGQTRFEFEAASIKSNPQQGEGLRGTALVCQGTDGALGRPAFAVAGPSGAQADPVPQGRCVGTNVTARTVVSTAYGVPLRNVSGGPGWLDSEAFRIEAKAENTSTATTDQLRRMLQSLLADRFKLVVHSEKKEGAGFALLVAKNGPKLAEASSNAAALHTEMTRENGGRGGGEGARIELKGKASAGAF